MPLYTLSSNNKLGQQYSKIVNNPSALQLFQDFLHPKAWARVAIHPIEHVQSLTKNSAVEQKFNNDHTLVEKNGVGPLLVEAAAYANFATYICSVVNWLNEDYKVLPSLFYYKAREVTNKVEEYMQTDYWYNNTSQLWTKEKIQKEKDILELHCNKSITKLEIGEQDPEKKQVWMYSGTLREDPRSNYPHLTLLHSLNHQKKSDDPTRAQAMVENKVSIPKVLDIMAWQEMKKGLVKQNPQSIDPNIKDQLQNISSLSEIVKIYEPKSINITKKEIDLWGRVIRYNNSTQYLDKILKIRNEKSNKQVEDERKREESAKQQEACKFEEEYDYKFQQPLKPQYNDVITPKAIMQEESNDIIGKSTDHQDPID